MWPCRSVTMKVLPWLMVRTGGPTRISTGIGILSGGQGHGAVPPCRAVYRWKGGDAPGASPPGNHHLAQYTAEEVLRERRTHFQRLLFARHHRHREAHEGGAQAPLAPHVG